MNGKVCWWGHYSVTFVHTCSRYALISLKDLTLLTAKTHRNPSPVLIYWSLIALQSTGENTPYKRTSTQQTPHYMSQARFIVLDTPSWSVHWTQEWPTLQVRSTKLNLMLHILDRLIGGLHPKIGKLDQLYPGNMWDLIQITTTFYTARILSSLRVTEKSWHLWCNSDT